MAKLIIEKNIPLPDKVGNKKYPFKDMVIGDSFIVKLNTEKPIINQKQNIYIAVWRYCQVHPEKKFTTASYDSEVRIWRTK